MPIFETFSSRKRKQQTTGPDVYQYTEISDVIRGQVIHILNDAIGNSEREAREYSPDNEDVWIAIRKVLCRERGRPTLTKEADAKKDCLSYVRSEMDVDLWLDIIELAFLVIDKSVREQDYVHRDRAGVTQSADDAIEEINHRFREAALGYEYSNGKIIRIDSQLIHSEIVTPALQLLSDSRFKGPQEEFIAAHGHYRAGEYKDALVDALNAFESTMKAICDLKKWDYQKGARASDLIKVIRANRLLPDYLDGSFDQLIATLQSGLPKVRNEEGGHGQGATPRETPGYVAAYALHLAAAKIVLLVEAFKAHRNP